jgi:hypothetical protein
MHDSSKVKVDAQLVFQNYQLRMSRAMLAPSDIDRKQNGIPQILYLHTFSLRDYPTGDGCEYWYL